MIRRFLAFGALGIIWLGLMIGCFNAAPNQIEHANVDIAASPDGINVAFSSADGDLFLFELDKQNVRRLTNTKIIESSPAFSADGRSLVYAANHKQSKGTFIFVRSLDGQRVQQLTDDSGVSDTLPQYSRDGSQIVFARAHLHRKGSMGGWRWNAWDVYVMNADGSNLRRLTQMKYYGINKVLFSYDGQAVFYSADTPHGTPDSAVTMYEVSVNGPVSPSLVTSNPKSAGNSAAWISNPALSPDGKYFVFISDRNRQFHYDLMLKDRQTGNSRSLGATRISPYNQNPVITSDGKNILFLAGTEQNASSRWIFSLWSMDIDGKNTKQIASSELFTDPINWKPNP